MPVRKRPERQVQRGIQQVQLNDTDEEITRATGMTGLTDTRRDDTRGDDVRTGAVAGDDRQEIETESSRIQNETEAEISQLYANAGDEDVRLNKRRHVQFLKLMLGTLPGRYKALDASRPWIIYWSANALALMGHDLGDLRPAIASSVLSCQNPATGGIGGGYLQTAHLATTYAGISALALSEDEEAWAQIDRTKLYDLLLTLKQPDGSFVMQVDGESDVRATYCALAVASLLDLLTEELVSGVAENVGSYQTYEGGFGALAGNEAHGGYAFCALAALCILGPPAEVLPTYLDFDGFLKWLSSRQYDTERSFSGRTNKLVDGCYNHWVGGCWALAENAIVSVPRQLWDRQGLQDYTLICAQAPNGGLRDKPGKGPDAYHSNYTLAGLSGAQHDYTYEQGSGTRLGQFAFRWTSEAHKGLHIPENSTIVPINPVHVLPSGKAEKMYTYFRSGPRNDEKVTAR